MKPHIHCKNSAKKYGGKPEEYEKYHAWLDQTKTHVADLRHRVILHNSFGVALAVQMFGETFVNSEGKTVPIRGIFEDHIIEDQGFIPSLERVLEHTPITDIQAPNLRYVVSGSYKVKE